MRRGRLFSIGLCSSMNLIGETRKQAMWITRPLPLPCCGGLGCLITLHLYKPLVALYKLWRAREAQSKFLNLLISKYTSGITKRVAIRLLNQMGDQ